MKYLFTVLLAMTAFSQSVLASVSHMSLAGKWRFDLDRNDHGVTEKWFDRSLPGSIKLPGSLPGQGIGDPPSLETKWTGGIQNPNWYKEPKLAKYAQPGQFKFPYWLTPDTYYAGAAWFQRDIDIPQDWTGKRIVLVLERPHWETRVWVDGVAFGMQNSLGTPHQYDLHQLAPGKHIFTVRVDNRTHDLDVGPDSHSVSDHTQGNWNGVVGNIELHATPLIYVDDVRVYPDSKQKAIRVKGTIVNASGKSETAPANARLTVLSFQGKELAITNPKINWTPAGGQFETSFPLPATVEAWDEFHPNVYKLRATIDQDKEGREVVFGVREIATDGTQFTINGQKTFIRGTLECCIFPKTGNPPTDLESWRKIIRVCKSYGLNLIRFHSWCPPEAAFLAADEIGFYYQVECSSWANSSSSLGDGKPIDKWIYEEGERMIKTYGNHPSFILMPYGNEPGGRDHAKFLAQWVSHFKSLDSRRLYTSGSGWPQIAENQFHVTPDPRVQSWGGGLKSRINALPPETTTDYRDYISARKVPVISHEIGQWCVYPNFNEIPKYTGYLKAKNFEIFRDLLNEAGMGDLARKFLLASGKLQVLCYKEDIESALRTPGMGGFELLDLHDFPGQGTALVGVVDPFWEDKGYVTGKEYSRFCGPTVPLARLNKRVFLGNEKLEAVIEVANYGPAALPNATVTWKLVSAKGKTISEGSLPSRDIVRGALTSLGSVSADLSKVTSPVEAKLVVKLSGTQIENDWDVWIYPAKESNPPKDVLVTASFDDQAQARLRDGGKVLLTIPGSQVRNFPSTPVKLGFSSIFWNTAWTARQAPTTLGILCDPKHPALAEFPTDYYSNWQWWYLIHRAGALRLDLLPSGAQPVVRIIDDWFTARPLGLIVEGKVGAGTIVICGADLTGGKLDPASCQLRQSLGDYLASGKCKPAVEFSIEQIKSLFAENAAASRAIRSIQADSFQQGYEPGNCVDGDKETIWHSSWERDATGFPHELVVELTVPKTLTGLTALPRQDGNHNGWIKEYAVYTSSDGNTWGDPVAKGQFSNDAEPKTVTFMTPVTAKFIKLVALSGHSNGPWASLAEVGFLERGR